MKLTTPALQQCVVDRIPDESMGEQKGLALREHKEMRHEMVGNVVLPIEQVAQCLPAEALTEHRGSLEGGLVGRIEPIQTCLDEALDRAGHAGFGALLACRRSCSPA